MKTVFLIFALAGVAFCQDIKAVNVPGSSGAPTERALTDLEVTKFQLAAAQLELAKAKYKIQEFNEEIQPAVQSQNAIARAACLSVGVPENKILFGSPENECGINTGFGPDGKPLNGPDGKPTQPKVWRIIPPEKKK